MHTFKVWAPIPSQVEIEVNGQRHPMTREEDGWWSLTLDEAGPGTDYGFVLDGSGPFPDPRSSWQPSGVHGLSRLVDHAAFQWTDSGFQAPPLASGLIYELHVGTFTPEGTFEGVISRLDHLKALGVTHLELMPVNAFPGRHGWGYDGVDLYAVHHAYGPPDSLKALVNAAHQRGLAVLLDVVYNHLGPSGNYLAKFGPYFNHHYQTPWGPSLNFDGSHSDEVRRFFCDNALTWLREYHFDGLRLDAVHAIYDKSAEPFLEQLAREVEGLEKQLGRHFVLIAESDLNDPRLLWSRERGGFALDAQWNDDFHHALHVTLTGEREGYYVDFNGLTDLAKAMRDAFVYDGRHSPHRLRRHGRPAHDLNGDRFVVYLQNHDQIGNRARGDRLSHNIDIGRLKIGAALLLMSPFVPMLFMGEEWAASSPFQYFADHSEPDLAKAVREGRRREFAAFGWRPEDVPDPQDIATFERSRLNWEEVTRPPHAEILAWYRDLVALRHSEPALSDCRRDLLSVSVDGKQQSLVLERGPFTIACNLGTTTVEVPLRPGRHDVRMASCDIRGILENSVSLPPGSVVIARQP